MKDLPSPRDYRGVKGDGQHDDADGMQQWLDDVAQTGMGVGTKGTYGSSRTLLATGGKVTGAGPRAFTICKLPGFPADQQLLTNRTVTLGDYVDQDIAFERCGFRGLPDDESVTVQLVGFAGVSDLSIHRCYFGHHRYIGLSIENCYRPRITDSELTDFGHRTPVETPGGFVYEGGPALYAWANGDKFNILPWITGNHIHDCEWIAISIQGQLGHLTHNTIERCYEAGIFGAFTLGVIDGNIETDIKVKDGSGHGMETGGVKTAIYGNVLDNIDLAGIWLTNPDAVLVALNIISKANQLPGLTADRAPGALSVRTTTGKQIDAELLLNMIVDLPIGPKILKAPGTKVLEI